MAAFVSLTPSPDPSSEPKGPTPAFETILSDTKTVACNGGGGPLGHPRVYLNMGIKDDVVCPYCSRLFVLNARSGTSAHAVEQPQHRDAESGPPSSSS